MRFKPQQDYRVFFSRKSCFLFENLSTGSHFPISCLILIWWGELPRHRQPGYFRLSVRNIPDSAQRDSVTSVAFLKKNTSVLIKSSIILMSYTMSSMVQTYDLAPICYENCWYDQFWVSFMSANVIWSVDIRLNYTLLTRLMFFLLRIVALNCWNRT